MIKFLKHCVKTILDILGCIVAIIGGLLSMILVVAFMGLFIGVIICALFLPIIIIVWLIVR